MATTTNTFNTHFSTAQKLDVKPNGKVEANFKGKFNQGVKLTREDDRRNRVENFKTNIYDQTRNTPNLNYFGLRHFEDYNRIQTYSPAGQRGENSRVMTGLPSTSKFKPQFQQL